MGNSEKIARQHYLQVTEAHNERGLAPGAQGKERNTEAKRGKRKEPKPPKTAEKQRISAETLLRQVVAEGLEPPTSWV